MSVAANGTEKYPVLNAAMRLASDVSQVFTNSTRVDAFEQDTANRSAYKAISIDVKQLTAEVAHQMADLIEKRSQALWQSKRTLEMTAGNLSSRMTGDDVTERNISVASTSFSHLPVNLSVSSVKVPLDVDTGDFSVTSAIHWSRSLTQTMTENLVAEPSASWQYFGSREGFMRVYPGLETLENSIHTFDTRFERWYIEGSVLPADVVVLIDASGSMHGLPLKIANQTTLGIINLLTERDRLAIVAFSSIVDVLGCSKDALVHTTRETKSMLVRALSSVRSESVSSYEPAFTRATQLLLPVNATDTSRQKIIVLLTDGSPVRDLDYFNNWNVDRRIRVFSTVVGPTAHSTGSSPRLACENNGFYTEIKNLEGARDALRSFVGLLGRSMAFHNVSAAISPPTRSEIDGQHVVKLSLPVINGTDGIHDASLPAPNLLGVVGIDIPLSDLAGLVPSHIVGPLAYAFIIDNYGRSLLHPSLKSELLDTLATDILQLEGNSFADIRAAMLRGETGNRTQIRSIVSEIDDRVYVRQLEMIYSYMPLRPKSTVSVCLVVPTHHNTTIEVTESRSLVDKPSVASVSITPWLQCVNARDFNKSDVDGFIRDVDNGTACAEWKNRVILDVNETARLSDTWADDPNVCLMFVSTLSGVTRTKPHKFNCNISGYDPTNNLVAKSRLTRGLLRGNTDLIVESTAKNITQITKAVYYHTTPVAVVGVDIRENILHEIFRKNVQDLLRDTNRVYLIDQSGYILDYLQAESTTIRDSRRGHSISEYESSLINKAIQKGHFTTVTVSSYTTQCTFQQAVSSGAVSFFLKPWSLVQHYILVWLYNLTLFLMQADLISLISGEAFTVEATVISSTPVLHSCLRHQTVYSASDLSYYNRESYCCVMGVESTQCSASYIIAAVPNTNLLLVVIDGDTSIHYCDTQLESQLGWTRIPSPCTSNLSDVLEQSQPLNITNELGRYLCTSGSYSKQLSTVAAIICTLLAIVLHRMTYNY
ncbi:voltage-dependent calcium channel subunit alpha-2/delta-3-like [Corticium candelabrum]|uniref:voltage-dependent calcium channel subunit alpha-2/delta-3-like n=1 Tax=Corticium candelabrum TaxID=121492 RepID=UPI002E26AE43|nr:voltage-dependent calcium channel subunit alpha-2/delta-3-like [Corticium candelabrum]